MPGPAGPVVLGGVALLALLAMVLALRGLGALWSDASEPPAEPGPWPVLRTDPPRLGVITPALAGNALAPWRPQDLREVDHFERATRSHARIVAWTADWVHVPEFDAGQARVVAAREAVPEVVWEPWDASEGIRRPQPRFRLARIIAGEHDALLRRWGQGLARYGEPVRIRFAPEMNGGWYPWAASVNGNRPGDYVRAWRHVHGLVRGQGATNVRWVWSPTAGPVPAEQFPGPERVDVLGVSGFDGGTRTLQRRRRSFRAAFGRVLADLHALAPGLPVELTEVASAERGGDKAAWIAGMFDDLADRPYVRALTWRDTRDDADWRIDSSDAARRAFALGLREARAARRAQPPR